MRETVAVVALLYVLGYLLWQIWCRRSPARVVVICALRSASVPEEIIERFGTPTVAKDPERLVHAEFTIGYLTDAPGISVATISDEASLDERLGPYLRSGIFAGEREQWLPYLREEKWNAGTLYGLALEVLHLVRPRSLLVDFRPPPADVARSRRISTGETDLDLGIYAYELVCRLRRYSRYRDATYLLLFWGAEEAWVFTGRPSSVLPAASADLARGVMCLKARR